MKTWILMICALFSGLANAETITLHTTGGAGALHQYFDVPNESTLLDADGNPVEYGIRMLPPQQSQYLAGVFYIDGALFICPGMLAYPAQNVAYSYVCTNQVGAQVTLTLTETWYRKQINSGRAHYWITRWTLVSGSIER